MQFLASCVFGWSTMWFILVCVCVCFCVQHVNSVTKAHFLDHQNKQKHTAEDFKHSLPNKLKLGFTFLFLSVSMMMIAFSATIILMIRSKERWTEILLYSISFLPVGIFALAYFPLYLSLSKSYKYLLKKMIKAFPCRCWRLAMSNKSNRLQGGSDSSV